MKCNFTYSLSNFVDFTKLPLQHVNKTLSLKTILIIHLKGVKLNFLVNVNSMTDFINNLNPIYYEFKTSLSSI